MKFKLMRPKLRLFVIGAIVVFALFLSLRRQNNDDIQSFVVINTSNQQENIGALVGTSDSKILYVLSSYTGLDSPKIGGVFSGKFLDKAGVPEEPLIASVMVVDERNDWVLLQLEESVKPYKVILLPTDEYVIEESATLTSLSKQGDTYMFESKCIDNGTVNLSSNHEFLGFTNDVSTQNIESLKTFLDENNIGFLIKNQKRDEFIVSMIAGLGLLALSFASMNMRRKRKNQK